MVDRNHVIEKKYEDFLIAKMKYNLILLYEQTVDSKIKKSLEKRLEQLESYEMQGNNKIKLK